MRFCPYCSVECGADWDRCLCCGKRLPPGMPAAVRAISQPPTARPAAEAPPAPTAEAIAMRAPLAAVPAPRAPSPAVAPSSAGAPAPPPLPTAAVRSTVLADPLAVDWTLAGTSAAEPPTRAGERGRERDGGQPSARGGRDGAMSSAVPEEARPATEPSPIVPQAGALKPGILGSALYVFHVLRGIRQRRSASERLQREIEGVHHEIDGVLAELGRSARQAKLRHGPLAGEQEGLDAAEARRAAAEQAAAGLQSRRDVEERRLAAIEAERGERFDSAEAELARVEEALAGRRSEQCQYEKEVLDFDRCIKALLRDSVKKERDAEKAADPAARDVLSREAGSLSTKAERLRVEREGVLERAQALEGPIAALGTDRERRNEDLERARAELGEAARTKQRVLEEIDRSLGEARAEGESAAREASRRIQTLGTLLNLHRVPDQELAPLYSRIDVLRGGLGEREERIARLATEQQSYDRSTFQLGLLVLAGAAAALVVLVALVFVIF